MPFDPKPHRGNGQVAHSDDIVYHRNGVHCPVCRGTDDKTNEGRCWGFHNDEWCHCTRLGGGTAKFNQNSKTWAHKLNGKCPCGNPHGFDTEKPKAGKKSLGKIVATCIYTDANYNPVMRTLRYDPKDFRQQRPDGAGGWIWDLKGVKVVPYNLPGIVESRESDATIYVVEGEKDADRLKSLGLVATTVPMGAKTTYVGVLVNPLEGRRVVVIEDNDDPGRVYGQAVCKALHGHAKSVKLIPAATLPGVEIPPKGDVSDYFDLGGTVAGLVEIEVSTPEWKPCQIEQTLTFVLSDSQAGETDDFPQPATDMGNATRLAKLSEGKIRYCHPWKKWLNYDGKRWAVDQQGAIIRRAKLTVRSIFNEASKAQSREEAKELAEWAIASEDRRKIVSMIALAESEEGIPILPGEMDCDGWLLNVQNGTLDLRTGELRAHRREDLITKLCPIEYDPNAKCPLWDQTLSIFLIDPIVRAYWQRLMGYCITGVVQDQILPIAYGKGSNGKSTILGTMLDLLGLDYAMKAPPDLLMAKLTDTHPTDRADLFGKRMVIAIETEDGRRLNESMVKELTGGDRIRARRMREDFWEFDPTHKLLLATNHKPVVRGTDYAIWRRLELVPFTQTMSKDQAVQNMLGLLKAEFPGILAWAVRGCLEWQKNGLQTPESVQAATSEYREDEDVLGAFIADHCTENPSLSIKSGILYARYRQWAEAGGMGVLSVTRFGKAIEERGFSKMRSGGIKYRGIALRSLEHLEHLEQNPGLNDNLAYMEAAIPENGSKCSKCSNSDNSSTDDIAQREDIEI